MRRGNEVLCARRFCSPFLWSLWCSVSARAAPEGSPPMRPKRQLRTGARRADVERRHQWSARHDSPGGRGDRPPVGVARRPLLRHDCEDGPRYSHRLGRRGRPLCRPAAGVRSPGRRLLPDGRCPPVRRHRLQGGLTLRRIGRLAVRLRGPPDRRRRRVDTHYLPRVRLRRHCRRHQRAERRIWTNVADRERRGHREHGAPQGREATRPGRADDRL